MGGFGLDTHVTTTEPAAPNETCPLDIAAQSLRRIALNGPDLRDRAAVKAHHELDELTVSITLGQPDLTEFADVLICLAGTADYYGWTTAQIRDAVAAKCRVNEARTWVLQPDGTYQHAKTGRTTGDQPTPTAA